MTNTFKVSLHEALCSSTTIYVDGLKLRAGEYARNLPHDRSKAGFFCITSSDYHRVEEHRMNCPRLFEEQMLEVNEVGKASVYFKTPETVDGKFDLSRIGEKIEVTTITFIISRAIRMQDIEEFKLGILRAYPGRL